MLMRDPDFVIKFNPSTETQQELSRKIFQRLFNKRLHGKKPVIIGIFGGSGEGKSHTALKLQEIIQSIEGAEFKEYINDINVYTPLQYPEKINRILYDKDKRTVVCICMHEAREIISAANWRSFLNQAIGDINAMSRVIKRLVIIIVSQYIGDISSNIRKTLNYYCTVERPIHHMAKLRIYKMYIDDSDLDKPKLKKRMIRGVIISPTGNYQILRVPFFEIPPLPKDIQDIFDVEDYKSKSEIFKKKIAELMRIMKQEAGVVDDRSDDIIKYIEKNNLHTIFQQNRKTKLYRQTMKDLMRAYDITEDQMKLIREKLIMRNQEKYMYAADVSTEMDELVDKENNKGAADV